MCFGVDCRASLRLRASPEARSLAAEHPLLEGTPMTSTIAVIRHSVSDFDTWKTAYDGFAPIQAEHGVRAHQVLRSTENPNDVIVTHTFDSPEAAREFFTTPELKEAMGEAGVDAGISRDQLFRRGRERHAGRRLVNRRGAFESAGRPAWRSQPRAGQASASLLRVSARCSGSTFTSASTGMKFVSPAQRGTRCRWTWSVTPAPAIRPRFQPRL